MSMEQLEKFPEQQVTSLLMQLGFGRDPPICNLPILGIAVAACRNTPSTCKP
jgi:hypothetical protein